MSVAVANFKSSAVFEQIKNALATITEVQKKDILKQGNAVFELQIKNGAGVEQTWTLELKHKGEVLLGKPPAGIKSDIVVSVGDDTFADMVAGKVNGQKAFMTGKLKVKGNMMLATRIDTVLKSLQTAAGSAGTPAKAAAVAPVASSESAVLFQQLKDGLVDIPSAKREAAVKKTKAIFQFDIKAKDGKTQSFVIDFKNDKGQIFIGTGPVKPDVTILVSDKDFVDLVSGKLNGQKAFMTGKLKLKGSIMVATSKTTLSN